MVGGRGMERRRGEEREREGEEGMEEGKGERRGQEREKDMDTVSFSHQPKKHMAALSKCIHH